MYRIRLGVKYESVESEFSYLVITSSAALVSWKIEHTSSLSGQVDQSLPVVSRDSAMCADADLLCERLLSVC